MTLPKWVTDKYPEYPRAYCENRVLEDGTPIKFCWCAIYSAKHGRDVVCGCRPECLDADIFEIGEVP